jgi:Uma2 family endonuclease
MAPVTVKKPVKKADKHPLADIAHFAALVDRLGGIPLDRIRLHPPPGTATEKDVIRARCSSEPVRCELIDGVLVEKRKGIREALWATLIVHYLWKFLEKHDLGLALGADGFVRLFPGRIRIPDVSFIPWTSLPKGELPDEAIASIVPDFMIEVLSKSNTKKEIDLKVQDYFKSGAKLVWVINPVTQTADIYTAADHCVTTSKGAVLDAGPVLPGFKLSLKKMFAKGTRRKPKS